MTDLKFRVGPIRPPSEANSLLLQVTRGCTWNKCKFCSLYRNTGFKAFSADSIKEDIDNIAKLAERVMKYRRSGMAAGSMNEQWDINGLNMELETIIGEEERQSFYLVANWLIGGGENVFLQDGNTTALSSGRLTDVLKYLRETFPGIKRVTSYGRAENLAKVSAEGFAELKEAGLDRIHSGYESGSDEVLARINKGVTAEQEIIAGRAVKAGGIELSIYFMPGIGGKDLSIKNAEGTAEVVNAVSPDFVRIRTAAIKPGTELYDDMRNGVFQMCSDDDKVNEIRRLIELTDMPGKITSDHMINLLQSIEGRMTGSERAKMLKDIDLYRRLPDGRRRVFQLLRRTLRAYEPADMEKLPEQELVQLEKTALEFTDEEWAEKMNGYICRYV